MTEHSIEELKRQVSNAYAKMGEARTAHINAERRLHDARCKASGLMGKKATNGKGATILIHDLTFWGDDVTSYVKGFEYKKDGTLGLRERQFHRSEYKIVSE